MTQQDQKANTKFFVTTVVNHKCTKRFFLPETDRRQLTVFSCSSDIGSLILPFPALPENEIPQMPLGAELIDLTTFTTQFGNIFSLLQRVLEDTATTSPATAAVALGEETTVSIWRTEKDLIDNVQPIIGEQVVQEVMNRYHPEKFDFLFVKNYKANQLISYIHFLNRFEGSFVPGHYYSSDSTVACPHMLYVADTSSGGRTEKKGAPFSEDQAEALGKCLAGYPLYQIESSSLTLITYPSLLNGDCYFQLNKLLFK